MSRFDLLATTRRNGRCSRRQPLGAILAVSCSLRTFWAVAAVFRDHPNPAFVRKSRPLPLRRLASFLSADRGDARHAAIVAWALIWAASRSYDRAIAPQGTEKASPPSLPKRRESPHPCLSRSRESALWRDHPRGSASRRAVGPGEFAFPRRARCSERPTLSARQSQGLARPPPAGRIARGFLSLLSSRCRDPWSSGSCPCGSPPSWYRIPSAARARLALGS